MTQPLLLDPKQRDALRSLRDLHRLRARYDPGSFVTYVLRDELTNMPIKAAGMHLEWQNIISAYKNTICWSHIEAGKTQQISIGRTLFELGRRPEIRCAIVQNTDGQAQKTCLSIAKYIDSSPELHEVFPNLKRAKGMPWTAHKLYVERPTTARTPSIQTCGVHGNITGDRYEWVVIDDILDYENTTSESQREDLLHWLQSTLFGRMTDDGKICIVGNVWRKDDVLHQLAQNPKAWFAVRYPVVNDQGEFTWPERWNQQRLEYAREFLGPVEFNRQLMCQPRTDEDSRFRRAWIEACLENGRGRRLVDLGLENVPDGYGIFTGVDLSVGHKDSDLCCLFTIAVAPNEDRIVLDIESGRWGGPEIVERIKNVHHRFKSIVIVENNASQEFILQFTRKQSAVPVQPYTTNAKAFKDPHFGVESMATEMANGKWIIPCQSLTRMHPEVYAWVQELLNYDPRNHPGDRLMASFFAREGSRRVRPKAKVTRGIGLAR